MMTPTHKPSYSKVYRLLFIGSSIVIAFLIQCTTVSPNLVSNGSFDNISRCPKRISEIRLARGWTSSGSPDLFCNCSPIKSPVFTGLNFAGTMQPNTGDCYVGFIVNTRYKEYPTFELPRKMRKNTRYCIRFLYSRSPYSGVKIKKLGIYLHRDPLRNSQRGQPMRIKTADVQIADRPGVWTAVSFTFSCKGGERFLSIGSFNDDLMKTLCLRAGSNQKINRVFNYASSAYYFIEDIELTELRRGESCTSSPLLPDSIYIAPPEQATVAVDTAGPTSPFNLHDLYFETNKSKILPVSYAELNELADFLQMQPEFFLKITGHTDNVGTSKNNLVLSDARARAVAEYLVNRGIPRTRLSWEGFGDNKPVADNKTEDGRQKNRRVEFRLLNH